MEQTSGCTRVSQMRDLTFWMYQSQSSERSNLLDMPELIRNHCSYDVFLSESPRQVWQV